MEHIQGCDMGTQLMRTRRFPKKTAQFYAAEITLAIEHLHKCHIVHRWAIFVLLTCHCHWNYCQHISILYMFSHWGDTRFCTRWYQAFFKFSLLLIFSCLWFQLVTVVPKYLNFSTFSVDMSGTFMLQFCCVFYSWTFPARPFSLLVMDKASVLFFIVFSS